MRVTQQQRITIAKKVIRGIELTDEEKVIYAQICEICSKWAEYDTKKEKAQEKPKRKPVGQKQTKKRYTRKEKALFAIEKRAEGLENPKWMQNPIDFTDKSIPLGKRRVAYVRYLTHKGMSLSEAKYESVRWIH